MAKYERPSTAYTPITISANLTKYQDDRDAVPPVPISSEKVDADINKAFDHLNDLDADIIAIVAGGLPSQTGNTGKFLSSNGTSASWNFINTANLVDLSITTAKIVDNSVTLAKQAAGTSNTIQGFAGSGDPTEITTDSTLDLTSDVLSVKDVGVTLAKMANLTAGEIIVGNASNRPSAAAVGTAGQVLTSGGTGVAPTMQDVNVGWTLISNATASASTSIEFTSGIDVTYDTYMVIASAVINNTGSSTIVFKKSTDSGATWTLPSSSTILNITSTTILGNATAGNMLYAGTIAGEENSFIFDIFDITGTITTAGHRANYHNPSGNASMDIATHEWADTGINGIQFSPSAGNFTSGDFYLYGLKKA